MGAAACKCCTMSTTEEEVQEDRKFKKPRLEVVEEVRPQCQHAVDVLENGDLLGCILRLLGDENGLTLEQKGKIAQVNRFWYEVSKRMPVQLTFNEPMSSVEMRSMQAGIPGLQSLEFAGPSERHAESVLTSWHFQEACGRSLQRLINLPSRSLEYIQLFANLRELSICRRGGIHVMELIHGIVYDLKQLSHLTKLESLSLKEIGSQTASITNLEHLPKSLKHLRLEDTSFVHHPELTIPEICLDSLYVGSSKKSKIILPVDLIGRACKTTIKGQVVHLTGPPISVPPLEEDNLEVIVGHGVLVLLSISAERTEHETNLFSILSLLKTDTFQSLSIEMEPRAGSEISLVSRSDCRKDMKWKALETVESPDFVLEATKLCKEGGLGLEIHEEHVNGQPQIVRLWRTEGVS